MGEPVIQKGYIPGAVGRVTELHGTYYHTQWDFGAFFEAKVASDLAEFCSRYDDEQDGLWTATVNGRVEGSIIIDGIHADEQGAHLRFFIISDALRGQGVGNQLVALAVNFCRSKGYQRIYLWTFEGLHAARRLYEKSGFTLVEERRGKQWGTEVTEQRFELLLT